MIKLLAYDFAIMINTTRNLSSIFSYAIGDAVIKSEDAFQKISHQAFLTKAVVGAGAAVLTACTHPWILGINTLKCPLIFGALTCN
jgi:hypothetical protein